MKVSKGGAFLTGAFAREP